MGVAGTRWLSYAGATDRALDILPSLVLILETISTAPNFDADDRAIATGLLTRLLCKHNIMTLIYMDFILDKLATLSVKFQSSHDSLTMAIHSTTDVINELKELSTPESVGEVIQAKLTQVLSNLESVGVEAIEPLNIRVARHGNRETVEDVNYTKALASEMSRRFGEDTELLASMVPFTHVAWEAKWQRVSTATAFNLDCEQLGIELMTLRKHFQLIGTSSGKKVDERLPQFWQNFCAHSYTRQMYPEHAKFAAIMLTMPIGSCSVERCFSYTTRIGGDEKRQSLTEKYIQQLVRISQQAPPFPSSGSLTWPFTVSARTPEEATIRGVDRSCCAGLQRACGLVAGPATIFKISCI